MYCGVFFGIINVGNGKCMSGCLFVESGCIIVLNVGSGGVDWWVGYFVDGRFM